MPVGRELCKIRKQRGLSIREVVRASDGMLDKTTVSRIEHEERGLSLRAAYCFAKIYGVSMESIAELALKKRVGLDRDAFDASPEERLLVQRYRTLTGRRRRMTLEIIRAFALVGDYRTLAESRDRLVGELKQARKKPAR